MKAEHQLDLPRRLQIEFSPGDPGGTPTPRAARSRPRRCATSSRPSTWTGVTPLKLIRHRLTSDGEGNDEIVATVRVESDLHEITGSGNGPIAAFVDALAGIGFDVRVLDYHEHALSAGDDARAAAYVECAVEDTVLWGVGRRQLDRQRQPQRRGLGDQPRDALTRGSRRRASSRESAGSAQGHAQRARRAQRPRISVTEPGCSGTAPGASTSSAAAAAPPGAAASAPPRMSSAQWQATRCPAGGAGDHPQLGPLVVAARRLPPRAAGVEPAARSAGPPGTAGRR